LYSFFSAQVPVAEEKTARLDSKDVDDKLVPFPRKAIDVDEGRNRRARPVGVLDRQDSFIPKELFSP